MSYDNITIPECTSMVETNDLENASSFALERLGCSLLTVKKELSATSVKAEMFSSGCQPDTESLCYKLISTVTP